MGGEKGSKGDGVDGEEGRETEQAEKELGEMGEAGSSATPPAASHAHLPAPLSPAIFTTGQRAPVHARLLPCRTL